MLEGLQHRLCEDITSNKISASKGDFIFYLTFDERKDMGWKFSIDGIYTFTGSVDYAEYGNKVDRDAGIATLTYDWYNNMLIKVVSNLDIQEDEATFKDAFENDSTVTSQIRNLIFQLSDDYI